MGVVRVQGGTVAYSSALTARRGEGGAGRADARARANATMRSTGARTRSMSTVMSAGTPARTALPPSRSGTRSGRFCGASGGDTRGRENSAENAERGSRGARARARATHRHVLQLRFNGLQRTPRSGERQGARSPSARGESATVNKSDGCKLETWQVGNFRLPRELGARVGCGSLPLTRTSARCPYL